MISFTPSTISLLLAIAGLTILSGQFAESAMKDLFDEDRKLFTQSRVLNVILLAIFIYPTPELFIYLINR